MATLDETVDPIVEAQRLLISKGGGVARWDSFYEWPLTAVVNGFLRTDANGKLTWDTSSVTAHDFLSTVHTDTLAAAVVRGDVIIGNATPKWSRLAIGASNTFLRSDGTDVSWQTVTTAVHDLLSATHGDTLTASPVRGDIMIANVTPEWAKLTIGVDKTVLQSNGSDPIWQANLDIGSGTITSGAITADGLIHVDRIGSTATILLSSTTSGNANIGFRDGATNQWIIGWDRTANRYRINDAQGTIGDVFIVEPSGDILFDPEGNNVNPVTGFDINLGSLTKKYLSLHAAELIVETLVAQDTIATIGGRILVGPTTQLIADVDTVQTTIDVKHNEMASGDRVYLEVSASVEFMSIDSGPSVITGGFRYTVTRNLDGSGANSWSAGDAVFNTGTTGDGFIDIYSFRGVKAGTEIGPTIVGNVRNSATFNDWTERFAIGNLNGIYGFGVDTYGVGLGEFGAEYITIDATNGIRMFGNNALRIHLKADGSGLLASGNIKWDTAGVLKVGEWTINANDLSATNIKLVSGAAETARLEVGTGSNTAGVLSADSAADIVFWSGDTFALRANAEFQVSAAGSLTMKDVRELTMQSTELTISAGSITITRSFHSVDTESNASTDDLTNINGGVDGQFLLLENANSTRTVVVKDIGNIELGAATRTLDHPRDKLLLVFGGVFSSWNEVSFSNNFAGA